jgi:peptidoglycan/LPS O-acetylase OafA/YrhL
VPKFAGTGAGKKGITLELSNRVEVASRPGVSSGSLGWQGAEIPSLYGIRGIAAMAVVLSHVGVPLLDAQYPVICFFVLSGFLITHLLLTELDKSGDISLRRFYLRRALRIFPAFYGYAFCYIVGRIILKLPIDWPTLASCLTYTSNYFFAFGGHPLGTMLHTWSLAVEEQFYFLWPFLLWRFGHNRRGLLKGLVWAIVCIWTYRWIMDLYFPGTYVSGAFETRSDALAIGCLLAIANREFRIPRWLIDQKWLGLAAIVAICACSVTQLNGARFAWSLVALACAVILIQAIAHSQSGWYHWLDSWPLHALGVISYSLYLYHPFANRLPAALRHLPIEIAFAITLATASYFIVERPFLRLKDRLSRTPRPKLS